LLDRYVPGLAVDSVLVDSKKAADRAISQLIEHGHRRIGLVTGAGRKDLIADGRNRYRHLLSTAKERIDGPPRAGIICRRT
jgi:DNA-binding LacI/PurR family transcriptional regulator